MKTIELKRLLEGKTPGEQMRLLTGIFPGNVVFTTSFGIEDQVITHMIFSNEIPVDVVTLDTGRLFPETYKVFSETITRYGKKVKVFYPYHDDIERMVTLKGPFSFYSSKEDRHECCRIRKLVPLDRALQGKECWISGIRSDQSDNRGGMDWLEYDEERKLFRFHPIFNWSFEDVRNFVSENNIPYNILHDKGFVSIGCQPCTRAIADGADFRSGRWWWETGSERECGLHIK